MNRVMTTVVLCGAVVLSAFADLKTEHKSKLELPGAVGKVVGFFGGKSMREGFTSVESFKGDRSLRRTDKNGELIDLAEEKVYQLDFGNKSYTTKTFAEIKKELEEQMQKAREERAKEQPQQKEQAPEYEVDFDVKETGNKEKINGFDTHEVLMTATVRQKGKKLEDGGGGVINASLWMGPKLANADEALAFHKRYAEKIGLMDLVNGRDIATVLAGYPGLKDAMQKLRDRQVNMDGTAVRTVMTIEAVASPEQRAEAEKQEKADEAPPTSVGGLFGKLGKKLAKKEPPKDSAAAGRVQVMKMTTELLKYGTDVAPADVAIPPDFKQKS